MGPTLFITCTNFVAHLLQDITKTFSRLSKVSKSSVENSFHSLLVYKCSNGGTTDTQQRSIFSCF